MSTLTPTAGLRPSIVAGKELMEFLPEKIAIRYGLFVHEHGDNDVTLYFNANLMSVSHSWRRHPAPLLNITLGVHTPGIDRVSSQRILTEGNMRDLTERVQNILRRWEEPVGEGSENPRKLWVSGDPFVGFVVNVVRGNLQEPELVPASDGRFHCYHGLIAAALADHVHALEAVCDRFGEVKKLTDMLGSITRRFNAFVEQRQLELCKSK